MRVNLNDYVRFRLTEVGRSAIRKYDVSVIVDGKPVYDWFEYHKPDADGWYEDSLWMVMAMLGPTMGCGFPVAILENAIEIGERKA